MTEALLNPVRQTTLVSEVEPLTLAMNMEQARRNLLSRVLADDEGLTLLLKHCRSNLDNGLDICQIDSDKTVEAIIVQDKDFVQPNLGQTAQYLLENSTGLSSLSNMHFLPGLLIEVSGLCLNMDGRNNRLELAQAAQDLHQLRQRMIAVNVGLVAFVANKHQTTVLSFDDLVQEGVVGLIKAVDRFDPYRGFQFSTYAVPWIKQAISRLIVKQEKIVRLPVALAERASVLFEAMRNTYLQTERWPSVEQLKLLCDLSEDEIKTIRNYYQANHSLDASEDVQAEEGQALMARMKQQQFALPLDELIENNFSQYLDQVVSTLPDKEAAILTMRFGLKNQTEMTFQAIADQLQVSRERVRQIQNAALKKLKNQFGYELMLFLEPNDSY